MRKYVYSESGPQFYEQYELTLADDSTFELGVDFSDPAGWAGGHSVSGTWKQEGDQIHFQITQRSADHATSKLEVSTVRGDELVVPSIGTFWQRRAR